MRKSSGRWQAVHDCLLDAFGPQHWWPGETPFEVMVGAVLTQNTAWRNVERAIASLKDGGLLSGRDILDMSHEELAARIRPAGYFNVKARRLRNLCDFLHDQGVLDDPRRLGLKADAAELRRRLLTVNGIGEETADSILLYALELPVFVIDAYTHRIFSRLGMIRGDETYAAIQVGFEHALPRDVELFNEYHALIVRLGKDVCRPRPRCAGCPLRHACRAATIVEHTQEETSK